MCRPNYSCGIPDIIAPGLKVIVFYLATLAACLIIWNSPMRTSRATWSHYGSQHPRSTSSAQKTPKLRPTTCTSLVWTTDLSSTFSEETISDKIVHSHIEERGIYQTSLSGNRWGFPVLLYHKIMAGHPYPVLVLINLLFSCIICINVCIFILTGSLA